MRSNPFLFVCLLIVAGCYSSVWKSTGQIEPVATDKHGNFVPGQESIANHGKPITKGESFLIRLDAVYPMKIAERGGVELMVYAEIYDRPDEEERLVNVVFKENDQAERHILNFRNRILLGPIAFEGHPIRVRLFLVELDKEENDTIRAMVNQATRVVGTFAPGTSSYLGAAKTIGNMLLALRDDERVIQMDMTLFPADHDMGPYLSTGYFALIKRENAKRYSKNELTGTVTADKPADDVVLNEFGERVDTSDEDYTRNWTYEDEHGEVLPSKDGINRIVRLRVMDGQIWRQVVALEEQRSGRTLLADPTFSGLPSPIVAKPEDREDDEDRKYYDVPLSDTKSARYELKQFKVGPQFVHRLLPVPGEDKKVNSKTIFTLGERIQYTEKTWAVLSVSRGGPPVPRSVFQEMSERDQAVLDSSLQPGTRLERLREQIEQLGDDLVKIRKAREVRDEVSVDFSGDADARVKGGLPVAYLQRLEIPVDPKGEDRDVVLSNESIIEHVRSITRGFPFTPADAADAAKLRAMLALGEDSFVPRTSPAFPEGTGKFVYADPAEIVGAPNGGKIDILAGAVPIELLDVKSGTRPDVKELQFELEGSESRATAGNPSTLGKASLDAGGKFTPGAKVPAEPETVLIHRAKTGKLAGKVRLAYAVSVKFDETVTVSLKGNGAARLGLKPDEKGKADWLKRQAVVTLEAKVVRIQQGAALTPAQSKVTWKIEDGPGSLDGNTYTAPEKTDGSKSHEVTLVATSDLDYRVTRRVVLVIAPG